jgi:hypothetical protein
MKLFKSQKQPQLIGRTEALACIPAISPAVSWQVYDTGDVHIEYPLAIKPLLRSIFNRFNNGNQEKLTRKLQLDTMGSIVWQNIDGKKCVRDLIRDFAATSTVTNQEAELSVTTFLRELGKRGLIVLL